MTNDMEQAAAPPPSELNLRVEQHCPEHRHQQAAHRTSLQKINRKNQTKHMLNYLGNISDRLLEFKIVVSTCTSDLP